jgi:hypothetical protein
VPANVVLREFISGDIDSGFDAIDAKSIRWPRDVTLLRINQGAASWP